MLRRKFILLLGSLIVLLLVGGVSSILLLHSLLEDMIHVTDAAVDEPQQLRVVDEALNDLDEQLFKLRDGEIVDQPRLAVTVSFIASQIEEFPTVPEEAGICYLRIQEAISKLKSQVVDSTMPDVPSERIALAIEALTTTGSLRDDTSQFGQLSHKHRAAQQQKLVTKLRAAGLVVGIGFLLLLNVSIVVLLRAVSMILKPINQLVEASRRLALEEYDYRVHVDQRDEFGELAMAFNNLAEQLQTNENRKVETLKQVARTLSHELNNAISTIDLQLVHLERRSSDQQKLAEPLRHIHDTLGRMSNTIGALHRVRRVVLTDYLSGIKMLDLERSVADEPPAEKVSPDTMTEIKNT